jgi:hypothetical protein
MCCTTHDVMDRLDRERRGIDVAALTVKDTDFRCRCPFGSVCLRQATAEDLLCDRCRGLDHQRWCDENPQAYGPLPGPSLRSSWDSGEPPYEVASGPFEFRFEFRAPDPLADAKAAVRYVSSRYPGSLPAPGTDLTPSQIRRLFGG